MLLRVNLMVLLGLIVGSVFIFGLTAGAAPSTDGGGDEVGEAQERLAGLRMDAGAAYEAHGNAVFQLGELDKEIAATTEDLKVTEEDLGEAQARLEDRASRMYKSGNVGFVDVLVGAENFSEFSNRLELWVRLLVRERAEFDRVSEIRNTLAEKKTLLEMTREQRVGALEEADSQLDRAFGLEEDAQAYLSSLNAELQAAMEAEQIRQAELARAEGERIRAEIAEAEPEAVQISTEVPEVAKPNLLLQATPKQQAAATTEAVEVASEQAEIASEQAEVAPEVVEAAPEQAEVAPEAVEAAPEVVEAAPEVVEAAPEQAEVAPEAVEAASEQAEVTPQRSAGAAASSTLEVDEAAPEQTPVGVAPEKTVQSAPVAATVSEEDAGAELAVQQEAAEEQATALAREAAEQRAAEQEAAQLYAEEKAAAAEEARLAAEQAMADQAAAEEQAARQAQAEKAQRRAEIAQERAAAEQLAADLAAAEQAEAEQTTQQAAQAKQGQQATTASEQYEEEAPAGEQQATGATAADKQYDKQYGTETPEDQYAPGGSTTGATGPQPTAEAPATAAPAAEAPATTAPAPAASAPASGSAVVAEAAKYMGTPYVLGGPDVCVPYEMMDCTCLTMTAYAAIGISLPDEPAAQYAMGVPVSGPPQAGDLLFWNEDGSGITHVGIATGNGTTIHASTYEGYVTETAIENIPGFVEARRIL